MSFGEMENEKDPSEDRMNGAFDTLSEAEAAYQFSTWLGAVIIYLLRLGRKPFEVIYVKKYRLRNTLLSYAMNWLLILLLAYFAWSNL